MNSTSTMALSSLLPKTAPHLLSLTNPFSSSPSTLILPFRFHFLSHLPPLSPLKAASSGGDSLRSKPLTSQGRGILEEHGNHAFEEDDDDKWIDWEDQILEDTVPLVGFVRMILHSGQYESGDRLSEEHEKTIIEKLLPFHPEFEQKIGCGVDYITIGYHPDFERSRCLFIVRQDGQVVDFSYWKCIKGLIRKNYPLYADTFILRHFRKKSRNL
ncbi:protein DCL, chloroplastic [Vigna unguiculata]|uniref:protein DCL, chloroplastic n=1 Tax=Vigna unguiculata TaxID=3917 RepID=UPI0010160962|nr:protein DCL, chloroplastic [Vigna unguiculata]